MQRCPHCATEISIKELPHPGLLQNYRVCPTCNGRFTVDSSTKRRQAIFIGLALVSLIFTLGLYFDGTAWLAPALISYIVVGLLIYWGNKKVFFVPYTDCEASSNDT